RGSGAEGPNGHNQRTWKEAKQQAGNFDPGMEVAERRQPLRASKKPLRATGSGQEAASGELEGIDPGAGENGHRGAEQRIVRRFCLQCSMPCMPVVSQAGNQVTWNHFFLWQPCAGFPMRPLPCASPRNSLRIPKM